MNRYLIIGLLSFLGLFELHAQEEYIGLTRLEVQTLSNMAADRGDNIELLKVDAYQSFLNDLDTLYQVFSSKLSAEETPMELKKQLNERLMALDDLSYFARKYRAQKRSNDQVEAQLSLAQYYLSLEKLELKEYFLALNEGAALEDQAESSRANKAPYQANSKMSYYLGMGVNYSAVSYSNTELDPAVLGPGVSINDEPKGGFSRDLYFGASYQLNQNFSGFLELGWSGQSLDNETIVTIKDINITGGQASFITRRNIQHRYTHLRFGAAYGIDKLHLRLGLQLSFLNSFDLNTEQVDPFGEPSSQEYEPEEEYGFTKTRSFLIIGVDYPVYSFQLCRSSFFC